MLITDQIKLDLKTATLDAKAKAAAAKSKVVGATANPSFYPADTDRVKNEAAASVAAANALLALHANDLDADIVDFQTEEASAAADKQQAQQQVKAKQDEIDDNGNWQSVKLRVRQDIDNEVYAAQDRITRATDRVAKAKGEAATACKGCDGSATRQAEDDYLAAKGVLLEMELRGVQWEDFVTGEKVTKLQAEEAQLSGPAAAAKKLVDDKKAQEKQLSEEARTLREAAPVAAKEAKEWKGKANTLKSQVTAAKKKVTEAEGKRDAALIELDQKADEKKAPALALLGERLDAQKALAAERSEAEEDEWDAQPFAEEGGQTERVASLRQAERDLQAQVNECNREIFALDAEAKAARDEMKAKWEDSLAPLREKVTELERELQDAETQAAKKEAEKNDLDARATIAADKAKQAKPTPQEQTAAQQLESQRKKAENALLAAKKLQTVAQKKVSAAQRELSAHDAGAPVLTCTTDPGITPEKLAAAKQDLDTKAAAKLERDKLDRECQDARDKEAKAEAALQKDQQDLSDVQGRIAAADTAIKDARDEGKRLAQAMVPLEKAEKDASGREGAAIKGREALEKLRSDLKKARDDAEKESTRPVITTSDDTAPATAIKVSWDHLCGEVKSDGALSGFHYLPDATNGATFAAYGNAHALGAYQATVTIPSGAAKTSTMWPDAWDKADIERATKCAMQSPDVVDVSTGEHTGKCKVNGSELRVGGYLADPSKANDYNTLYPRI